MNRIEMNTEYESDWNEHWIWIGLNSKARKGENELNLSTSSLRYELSQIIIRFFCSNIRIWKKANKIGCACGLSWMGMPAHMYSKVYAYSLHLGCSRILPTGEVLRCFFTPSHVRSASDRLQFASDLGSDLRSEVPFRSKRIRWTHDPGLLWSQLMVPTLCFRKRQPFFAHSFEKNSTRYSILSLQVTSLSSAASLVEWILLRNQTNFLSIDPSVRPETSERC